MNGEVQKIEFGSFAIYERGEPAWKSKLFGVPVYVIGIIGAVIYLIRRNSHV